jgi:hypothetical protein
MLSQLPIKMKTSTAERSPLGSGTCSSSLDLALRFDPFADDFGDQSDRILRDKIVKARKAAECFHCAWSIRPGEMIRSRADVIDGGLMSWKWCNACTQLMAACDDKGLAARCRMND